VGLNEMPADHSTISRTRRLIDLQTHQAGVPLGAGIAGGEGSAEGQTIGIDATTLEANAAQMVTEATDIACARIIVGDLGNQQPKYRSRSQSYGTASRETSAQDGRSSLGYRGFTNTHAAQKRRQI